MANQSKGKRQKSLAGLTAVVALGILGTAAIAEGAIAAGVAALAAALFSLVLKLRVGLHSNARDDDIKVVQPRSVLVFCLFGGFGFGALAFFAFRSPSSNGIGGGLMLLVAIGCIAAALFFASLARTSTSVRSTLRGENVLAEGIGRAMGVHGQVVVATDRRIASLPARLVGQPAIAISIPYDAVEGFETNKDSLFVRGRTGLISLKRCPPNQVAALVAELQKRTTAGTAIDDHV